MIPFLTSTYWRAGLAIALVGLFTLAGWRLSVWHRAYEAYPALQAQLAAEVACEAGTECSARLAAFQERQAAVSTQVVEDYEQELADLRARPVERRVIRVCPPASGDVRHAGAARPAHGAGPAAGGVPRAIEFDTGALRDLARDADELSARLRALQQWNEALSQPAPVPAAVR
jgi:hypothetical protein